MNNPADTTHHTDLDESQTGEANNIESTIQQQLQLIDKKCFDENLSEYLALHPEITFTAEEITTAAKDVIKGKSIAPELLTFLRKYASSFYLHTKQKPRHPLIPAGMGFKEWSDAYRDSIRAVMGKIDATMGLGAKLEERVRGFNLNERVTVRADQLQELGTMLGLNVEDAKAMGEELTEMVREASLPYTQDYGKLKQLARNMNTIGATSIGVDFSDILAKYWHPSAGEIKSLLSHDFKEGKHFKNYTEEVTRDESLDNTIENKNSEGYKTALLLAALRKTFGTPNVMIPVNTQGTLDQNDVPMMQRIQGDAKIFFYNITDGLQRKMETSSGNKRDSEMQMQSLSQWLSITFARLMNNQKIEQSERTLHDNMTAGTPYAKYGLQAPNFEYHRIVAL